MVPSKLYLKIVRGEDSHSTNLFDAKFKHQLIKPPYFLTKPCSLIYKKNFINQIKYNTY